jgi:hypothetical protein
LIQSSISERALARVWPVGGAQMAQPGEVQQVTARSSDGSVISNGERRSRHDLAGEGEAAAIDLGGAGGIGSAWYGAISSQSVLPVAPAQQRVDGPSTLRKRAADEQGARSRPKPDHEAARPCAA